jgi:hypothetical protein
MYMTATTLIFYPETFIGFNKTQLLKRRLAAAGVIGAQLKSSSAFSAGQNFRQYIPKAQSIYQYHSGVIRIQIQAVGVWMRAANFAILDRSNIVLVEGDAIEFPLDRYASLCELLYHITGDGYQVEIAYEPIRQGISEESASYAVNLYSDSVP